MINTKEGAQARVKNLSYDIQLAELESQMEQEAFKEQMLQADLECQAEQDAILDQMMLEELSYEAEQDAVAEAMYLEELAYGDEQDVVAEAMFLEELNPPFKCSHRRIFRELEENLLLGFTLRPVLRLLFFKVYFPLAVNFLVHVRITHDVGFYSRCNMLYLRIGR